MHETEGEQYIWQEFHRDQIRTQDGNLITVDVYGPFARWAEPEQWTIGQRYGDGSVFAYKPVRKPEQGA